ncbi:MAG: hypothetical protein ACODAD_00185 [Planctomycetota bacterium]
MKRLSRSTHAVKGQRRAGRSISVLTIVVLVLVSAGCGDSHERLITDYGRRRGSAASSVNGTTVLAEMFRKAGGRPATVTNLSSNLADYDVIIWAPDDFEMPRRNARAFLEQWLKNKSGRTLVYIGRDYDAAPAYWQSMISKSPPAERREVMRRLAEAQAAHGQARLHMPREACCEWFVMRRDYPGRYVNLLDGPWSRGIDVKQSRIWSQGRLDIPTDAELSRLFKDNGEVGAPKPRYSELLDGRRETLAFRVGKPTWKTSQVLVMANGSFLLNLPLVNDQHRRLAGRLISECRPFEKVAFLESRSGGPQVAGESKPDDDKARRSRVLLAAHWFILGLVFCFYLFPIFGRPKSIETEAAADFGEHIEAMATLLERTGDKGYAARQLTLYHKGKQTKHVQHGQK